MVNNFALLDLSTPDLAIILLIILLLFGSKRLPELSKSVGTSLRELKKGLSEVTDTKEELKKQVAETTTTLKEGQQQPPEQPRSITID
jgi:sec-independent protein translocase protein TatA